MDTKPGGEQTMARLFALCDVVRVDRNQAINLFFDGFDFAIFAELFIKRSFNSGPASGTCLKPFFKRGRRVLCRFLISHFPANIAS